jgi:diguanylate cyclase (GGDEF)-like protein
LREVSIAIIAPLQPEDFFDLLWQGVWEATFDLAPFGVQVRNLPTERYDVAGQREMLAQLLEDKVDGIAVVPAHGEAINRLIDEHEGRGAPVVTFHSDAPESRRSAFVGPDPFQAGVLAGELLVKLMGGKGQALAFPGSSEKHHLAERERGFRGEFGGHPQCHVVTSSIRDLELLETFPAQSLGQLRSANGVYVGDEGLVKVAAALEQAGVRVPCVGFGNTDLLQPFLARQTVSAVIDEQRYLQGYFAVQKVYEAFLKRESGAAVSSIRIPCDVALAANATDSRDSLHAAFEMLLRQRTEVLCSYKQRLEEANVELENLSTTDPLTGLFNRRKFDEMLAIEVARARRYGTVSLLMIDLNHFKLVNDRHGHQAGDEMLKSVARLLKCCCRGTDACARLGGDEFAVILPHADTAVAGIVRDRILKETVRTIVPVGGGQQLSLSLSIGIASLAEAPDTLQLVATADADMYRVKQASRAEAISGQAPIL